LIGLADEYEDKRRDINYCFDNHIKENLNYIQVGKIDDPYNYACAVYVCRISDTNELVDHTL